MLHKLSSLTTDLLHDWKMYGAKKENGDIEIKLTHQHFEPTVFDRVLRFDDAILLGAWIKILTKNLNLEGAHTATLEGSISKKIIHQVTGHAGQQLMTYTAKYYGLNIYRNSNKVIEFFFGKDPAKEYSQKNESIAKTTGRENVP